MRHYIPKTCLPKINWKSKLYTCTSTLKLNQTKLIFPLKYTMILCTKKIIYSMKCQDIRQCVFPIAWEKIYFTHDKILWLIVYCTFKLNTIVLLSTEAISNTGILFIKKLKSWILWLPEIGNILKVSETLKINLTEEFCNCHKCKHLNLSHERWFLKTFCTLLIKYRNIYSLFFPFWFLI